MRQLERGKGVSRITIIPSRMKIIIVAYNYNFHTWEHDTTSTQIAFKDLKLASLDSP